MNATPIRQSFRSCPFGGIRRSVNLINVFCTTYNSTSHPRYLASEISAYYFIICATNFYVLAARDANGKIIDNRFANALLKYFIVLDSLYDWRLGIGMIVLIMLP